MRLLILLNILFIATLSKAQIKGNITDRFTHERLIGASIRGGAHGSVTDINGNFVINAIAGDTIEASLIGYHTSTMVIASGISFLDIQLESASLQLDEIIVTGVFDPRKRIESSVAITTLSTKQLERIVPNSSAELLRNIPGVFVQSARGELRNQVFSRGMVFNGGGNFVSFHEDGLPIVSGQSSLDGNGSEYLRADMNLSKIEAVRGGSASVLGVSAPGGIFNYISKTGGDHFEGIASSRIGLEGNGKNPYYRLEGNIGGPINNDKSFTYNIGGHYRYAYGAKYPGYPLSHGGQLKGNILKTYKTGSLKLNLKVLNDHTKDFEFTPTQDFEHPHPAGHFTNSSSVLIDAVKLTFPSNGDGIRTIDYNTKDLNHLQDNSIGLNWEQRFGDNWKTTQLFKYSSKQSTEVGTFIVYPNDVTSLLFNLIFGNLGREGDYKLFNASTRQVYGILTHDFTQANPFTFSGNLPGSDIISNGVFFTPLTYRNDKINDLFYQGTVSKVYNDMKFTIGLYSNRSSVKSYDSHASAGTAISTIEDKPQTIGIEYAPLGGGPVQHITDQYGVSDYQKGPGYAGYNDIKTWNNSIFFGHQWNITPRLNLDWGFRLEWLKLTNTYQLQNENTTSTSGGNDHDPLTIYDNALGSLTKPISYTKYSNTGSYSAGLNYVQNKNLAYYLRYSSGNKVPDIGTYVGNQQHYTISHELPLKTAQLEGGVKYQSNQSSFSITPYYSILSNIPQGGFASNIDLSFYELPVLYNKSHATGVELETYIQLDKKWGIRANGVIQKIIYDRYRYWDSGDFGSQDDKIIDQSGKKLSFFAAPYIFNVTPAYQHHKIYAGLNFYTLSRRVANSNEAFNLPAYSQFDLNLGYALSNKVNLKFTINNLWNTFGVIDWTAPIENGIFFDTFNTDKVSKETIKSNPNAIYYTMGIQPRSFFLDFTVKL